MLATPALPNMPATLVALVTLVLPNMLATLVVLVTLALPNMLAILVRPATLVLPKHAIPAALVTRVAHAIQMLIPGLAIHAAHATRVTLARLKASKTCLLYTSPSPRDATLSRMPSSA